MAQDGVADGYELYYYSVSPRDNPLGPESAPYKVYRGGSWGDVDDRLLSVYYRNFTDPDTRTATIGFPMHELGCGRTRSAESRSGRLNARCLRCLLLVMSTHPSAKKALTLHLARSEGHERYFGCNLMHR